MFSCKIFSADLSKPSLPSKRIEELFVPNSSIVLNFYHFYTIHCTLFITKPLTYLTYSYISSTVKFKKGLIIYSTKQRVKTSTEKMCARATGNSFVAL